METFQLLLIGIWAVNERTWSWEVQCTPNSHWSGGSLALSAPLMFGKYWHIDSKYLYPGKPVQILEKTATKKEKKNVNMKDFNPCCSFYSSELESLQTSNTGRWEKKSHEREDVTLENRWWDEQLIKSYTRKNLLGIEGSESRVWVTRACGYDDRDHIYNWNHFGNDKWVLMLPVYHSVSSLFLPIMPLNDKRRSMSR